MWDQFAPGTCWVPVHLTACVLARFLRNLFLCVVAVSSSNTRHTVRKTAACLQQDRMARHGNHRFHGNTNL